MNIWLEIQTYMILPGIQPTSQHHPSTTCTTKPNATLPSIKHTHPANFPSSSNHQFQPPQKLSPYAPTPTPIPLPLSPHPIPTPAIAPIHAPPCTHECE